MSNDDAVWVNGPIERVVAIKGSVWAVVMQNKSRASLRCDDGSLEESYPHPGNRSKTEAEARRLANAHGVRAYRYDRERGYIDITRSKGR